MDRRFDRPPGSARSEAEAIDYLVNQVRHGISRRELLRKGGLLGLSLSALGPLLAACGGSSPNSSAGAAAAVAAGGQPKRGGTIRVGVANPGGTPDPLTSISKSGLYLFGNAYLPLVRFDPDGSLVPALATSWSSNPDATQWTVNLRQAKWTDGTPFTADDVVWTMNYQVSPSNADSSPSLTEILKPGNVQKLSPSSVRFDLERPYVDFISVLAGALIILPANYKNGDFLNKGKTLGPFVLSSYSPDVGATFVRNAGYFDPGQVYLDGADFTFYDDDQAIALAAEGGSLDIVPILSYGATVALKGIPSLQILATSSSQYEQLHLRVDVPPFDDVRVRQAFAYSLDRQVIIDTLFGGQADIGNDHGFAPVFPPSAAVIRAIPQREQDIPKAKSLLAAAGHPNGITVTLTTEQYLEIPQYAQLVQSQVKAAGFDIKLDIETQDAYYGSGNNQPWLQVPLGITDWGERANVDLTLNDGFASTSSFDESHFDDPTFDSTLAAYEGETNSGARAAQALQLGQILHDQTPAILAYWIKQLRIKTTSVHGLEAAPASYLHLDGVWLA